MDLEDVDLFEELWRVFSFYTLRHDPVKADFMTGGQFFNLLKDSRCVTKNVLKADIMVTYHKITGTRGAKPSLSPKNWQDKPLFSRPGADNLQRWSSYSRKGAGKPGRTLDGGQSATRLMDYDQMLDGLAEIAKKLLPKEQADFALERLLREYILPNACRLKKDEWAHVMRDPKVISFMNAIEEPLHNIFCFYAVNLGDCEVLGSTELFRLVHDCEFCVEYISMVEIGEIYMICCNHVTQGKAHLSFVTFKEFVDVVVRIAVVTHSKASKIPAVDMVKGMFHRLSERMQRQRVMSIIENRRDVSTNANFLLAGCEKLHARFYEVWLADGRPNYLYPEKRPDGTGRDLLKSIMRRNSSCDMQDTTRISPFQQASDRSDRGSPLTAEEALAYGRPGSSSGGASWDRDPPSRHEEIIDQVFNGGGERRN